MKPVPKTLFRRHTAVSACLFATAFLHGSLLPTTPADAAPVSSLGRTFESEAILGFKVRFDVSLSEPSKEWHRSNLQTALGDLATVAPQLSGIFRHFPIWICNHEHVNSKTGGLSGAIWNEDDERLGINVFHPSIASGSSTYYRALIVHEYGHCFQERCLRVAMEQRLFDAHRNALSSGLYLGVADEHGGTVDRAYALTDEEEYFAEAFASYLVGNSVYPVSREDLLMHDPVGHALLESLLGMDLATQHQPDLRFWFKGKYQGNNRYERFPRRQEGKSEWSTKMFLSLDNDGATDEVQLRVTRVSAKNRRSLTFRIVGRGRHSMNVTAAMIAGRGEAKVYKGYDRQLTVTKRKSSMVEGFAIGASSSLFPEKRDSYQVAFK